MVDTGICALSPDSFTFYFSMLYLCLHAKLTIWFLMFVLSCPVLELLQESTVVTCKSSSETIFSPNVEPVGAHSESDTPSDGGTPSILLDSFADCEIPNQILFLLLFFPENGSYATHYPPLNLLYFSWSWKGCYQTAKSPSGHGS